MNIEILTLFPEMIEAGLGGSIIGRALENGLLSIDAVNIRDYAFNKHNSVDDYTYGGGAGMLMQAEPVYQAYQAACAKLGNAPARVIYMSPQGPVLTQEKAKKLSAEENLIFLCGHYEGIDERVIEEIVTDEISIGDYIVRGGELAAMVVIDAAARFIPGVLHNETSADTESLSGSLLEYPQYSRPEVWHDKKVPEILLSGHHENVDKWRRLKSVERTARKRPDLLEKADLTPEETRMVKIILESNSEI